MNNLRNIDQIIGEKIRSQRLTRGMTQKALGAKLGISFQQVQKYESGANKLTVDRLHHLSILFAVTLDYWVQGGEGGCAAPRYTERRTLQLVNYFHRIESETIKSLLFAFTKTLAMSDDSPSPAS